MTQHPLVDKFRGVVECDETWIRPKEKGKGNPGMPTPERSKKRPVFALVERESGQVRSFPIERVTLANIKPIMKEHIEEGSRIQTDEATIYHYMRPDFPNHDVCDAQEKAIFVPDGRWSARHHEYCGGIFRTPKARPLRNVPSRRRALFATVFE